VFRPIGVLKRIIDLQPRTARRTHRNHFGIVDMVSEDIWMNDRARGAHARLCSRLIVLGSIALLSGCVAPTPYASSRSAVWSHARYKATTPETAASSSSGSAPRLNGYIGLDRPELQALLGDPSAEYRDGVSERLEFHDRGCSLQLRLYPEVDSRVYRTLTFEVSSDDSVVLRERACAERFASRLSSK
jgi:hypothetical protein